MTRKRITLIVVVSLAVTAIIVYWAQRSAVRDANEHRWSAVYYPDLNCTFADGTVSPSLNARDIGQVDGLRLDLDFAWSDKDKARREFAEPDSNEISVRLHYVDGTIVEPLAKDHSGALLYMGTFSETLTWVFPWGKNEMDEGWLELGFPDQAYWLAVPYGFTRNPSEELLPTSNHGRPELPAGLMETRKDAFIVNWTRVFYDFGEIGNGWRLGLFQSNPGDAHSTIMLTRDINRGSWNLESPATKLSIELGEGFEFESRAVAHRIQENGTRRWDSFEFARNPGDGGVRDWGTIVVSVDRQDWKAVIPSSLFRYVHGIAECDKESTWKGADWYQKRDILTDTTAF